MRQHYIPKAIITLLLFLLILGQPACLKKEFDAPPDNSGYDPQLPITHTIAELLKLPQGTAISHEVVISGIVVMDDKSGNYYNKIVIQDETGGIEILLDQNNLYNDYPLGRKVYINCKGLFLGDNGGNPQLGYTPDATAKLSAIPALLIEDFVVKASYPHTIIPDTFTLEELSSPDLMKPLLNTLIAVKDVEFTEDCTRIPYARPAGVASATNLSIQDCTGNTIIMRNSGYANFQPYLTPAGNGVLTGIYTRFDLTPQIYIRDTGDVHFYNSRCDGVVPPDAAWVSIDSIRNLYAGTTLTLGAYKIRGVVISDRENGNVANGTVVLQGGDDDKGMLLYYGSAVAYALGDSLEVDIEGATLKEFQGKLEIDGVQTARTTKLASGRSITPRVVSVAELTANSSLYESTLVKINQASFSATASTYNGNAGNLDITDATGTISHYCTFQASFKNEPLPASPVTSVTAYVDVFNGTAQLRIRKPDAPVNDVVP